MIYTGEKKIEKVQMGAMLYGPDGVETRDVDIEQEFKFPDHDGKILWLNIVGLHDIDLLKKVAEAYSVHPLVMEDILNTDQRPKIEFFDDQIFISVKFILGEDPSRDLIFEQISIVLGKNYVIVFQEYPGDPFDPVRRRITAGKGKIRTGGSGYLAYALIDVMVDHYFTILERLSNRLELIDEELLENPTQDKMNLIQKTKKELILLRRSIGPLRELTGDLTREEHDLINDDISPFYRNLHDHVVQVLDILESYREVTSSLVDLYLSSISHRMNEVMKVLTIIATIFIPTTFLAGIYGMNFEFMPELTWKYSYPVFWLVLFGVFLGMIIFFRRKKWL